ASQALFLEAFQGCCRGGYWPRTGAPDLELDQGKRAAREPSASHGTRPSCAQIGPLLADGAGRRDLEGETEPWQILAGVVIRIGQLRDLEVQRPGFLGVVDGGVEIDEVPPRLTGRLEEDLDVALAIEGAGIADIVVVVVDRVDVGRLGPAHALQMNLERRSGG